MAEYTPLFKPGQTWTSTASANVVGGRLVAVSGNGTVGPAGAASAAFVGVAAFDALANTLVTVFGRGQVHITTAAGAITAGDRVSTGAAGTIATAAAGVGNVGVALTTAADTALCTWVEI
jgi:hypothetical protein